MRKGQRGSLAARQVISANYRLIAKQLNDDAHDWAADLRRGHINSVAGLLIKERYGNAVEDHDVELMVSDLQQDLWQREITAVTSLVHAHLKRAEQALGSCGLVTEPEPLLHLLAPIRQAAEQAETKRQKTLDFLAAYKNGADNTV